MPSFDLFNHFQKDLILEHSWWINGRHYGQYVPPSLLLPSQR